ncbi:hypothetical protein CEP54_013043 [Fusarium duplospermum]|uniref:Uncharacterized protein n=1 Tax=Fusarium duplospermum TaxID=1325734 RepID=A0A428P587_9HYPO|nr:hypothetical protein CEP54_013043 [Fusarium duplospermum]
MSSCLGTILLTGANGGLGSAIVADILKKPDLASNYTGLYTVRKAATATQLKKVLSSAPKAHQHDIMDMDLGSLSSIRKVATEINRRVTAGEYPPIRVLILNAAYQDHEKIVMTDDGYETTWQVNYLANQLLALLLLQSMDKEKGRILLLGSWSHNIDDERNNTNAEPYKGWDTLFPGAEELAKGKWSRPDSGGGWYTGYRRYGASKLCAVMLMHELANRLARDPELSRVSVVGLDPGAMGSDLTRRGGFLMTTVVVRWVLPLIAHMAVKSDPNGLFRPLWKSAGDAVRLCFEVEVPAGKLLYLNGTDELDTGRESKNVANRNALWAYGLDAAQIKQGDTILRDWK